MLILNLQRAFKFNVNYTEPTSKSELIISAARDRKARGQWLLT
jgi:hypothetical protein